MKLIVSMGQYAFYIVFAYKGCFFYYYVDPLQRHYLNIRLLRPKIVHALLMLMNISVSDSSTDFASIFAPQCAQ